jgi:hypothetical protein
MFYTLQTVDGKVSIISIQPILSFAVNDLQTNQATIVYY